MKLKWGDFLIFAVILAVISTMFISGIGFDESQPLVAEISEDGKVLYDINLIEIAEAKEILLNDGHVKIVVENGRIRFVASDCRDKVCVNTGWIDRRGQIAACLPNKILIKIIGESPEVDVVID